MINIDSIKNGIVIDHIKPGNGFSIFEKLFLSEADCNVALIMNAKSSSMKSKDLIKIENVEDLDLTMLGYLDPNITINYVENEKIVKKINLSLPEKIKGIIHCKNPRCITNIENMDSKFILIDEKNSTYKCEYCDMEYENK